MFRVTTVTTLVTGTMFLMWLGQQITERGRGNGISITIFAAIVAGLPGNRVSPLCGGCRRHRPSGPGRRARAPGAAVST
jgi:preprotein translocase subunit SecY